MLRPAFLALAALHSQPATAQDAAGPPAVLADGAPTLGLVQVVMAGLGEPRPILPLGASLHDSGLTPGEAGALADADLIVWTGPALLPWLADALPALAPGAASLPLLDAPGWEPLTLRAGARLDGAAEGPEGSVDPHAWLDPAVAAAWLFPIAEALAEADPAHAGTYRANAEAGSRRLLALAGEVRGRLEPLAGPGGAGGLVVGHDAYQYLERAAGLRAAGAIEAAGAEAPSPARVADLLEEARAGGVGCVLLDPETREEWGDLVASEAGGAARVAVADPEGLLLAPGPDLYARLIEGVVGPLEGCLAP